MRIFHVSSLVKFTMFLSVALLSFKTVEAADMTKAKELYQFYCADCHHPDNEELGPKHRGVYGRKAGTLEGFPYSDGMKNSGIVWKAKELDAFLKNPEAVIPDTAMGFEGINKKFERYLIIQYLKSISE